MHKQNKTHKRPILTMAMANLESWTHSPRTMLMMIFTIMLCYLEVNRTLATYSKEGFILNWVEMPYVLFQNGINILMSSMLIFVMISEIPRLLPYQNNMLIRASRKRWLTSQIVYCLVMLLVIAVVITICILLFSLGKTEFGSGWSDTARIAQDENMAFMTVVPKHVREHYAPLTGVFYAAAPVFLFWFSMAMIILLCSLLGSQMIGLVICAFILLANFVGSYPLPYPINFATVSAMNPDEYGPELYRTAVAIYAGLDMTLVLAMYWRISKTDFVFYSENKL